MPDRRKRMVMNAYEEATDTALREAASRWGARVFVKLRLADALEVENSGLTNEEYSYALKAHFDFVVEHPHDGVRFTVEPESGIASSHDDQQVKVISNPYDPFLPSRAAIARWFEQGICRQPAPEILQARNPQGYVVSVALLALANGATLMGMARCRPVQFPPISTWELSEELAICDIADNLSRLLRREYELPPDEEIQAWRNRISMWQTCSDRLDE